MGLGLEDVEDGAVVKVGVRKDAIDASANAAQLSHRTFLQRKPREHTLILGLELIERTRPVRNNYVQSLRVSVTFRLRGLIFNISALIRKSSTYYLMIISETLDSGCNYRPDLTEFSSAIVFMVRKRIFRDSILTFAGICWISEHYILSHIFPADYPVKRDQIYSKILANTGFCESMKKVFFVHWLKGL